MTKDEIKALIQQRLAGQGNQVDCSSILPTILNEIVDMAGGGGGETNYIEWYGDGPGEEAYEKTKELARAHKLLGAVIRVHGDGDLESDKNIEEHRIIAVEYVNDVFTGELISARFCSHSPYGGEASSEEIDLSEE